jgi:branched-chain amino acid transport system ATP-binding protein
MALLEIRTLSKYFVGLAALNKLDLDVFDSEMVGLIGPNGAGKSTLFNVICGFYPPSEGNVIFKGKDITGLKSHKIARMGIGRSFQASTLFMKSTVLDNVLTGFHINYKEPVWKSFLHTSSARKEEKILREKAMEILDFTGLASQKDKFAENLSSGYQKTLAISIALSTNPDLLLLDEPVTTLSPDRVEMIMDLVNKVRGSGTTVVVIEHNMKAIMDYCDRIVVMAYGRNIAEGLPNEIRDNRDVIEAYLGDMNSCSFE